MFKIAKVFPSLRGLLLNAMTFILPLLFFDLSDSIQDKQKDFFWQGYLLPSASFSFRL